MFASLKRASSDVENLDLEDRGSKVNGLNRVGPIHPTWDVDLPRFNGGKFKCGTQLAFAHVHAMNWRESCKKQI